ncbi:MAG: hypothetical protein J6S10_00195 [Clostridia bacterium]|nr:hypothetical protein [Clostridia bacterium]MBO7249753.1 hypothetical protein [Clostridia bacterium]
MYARYPNYRFGGIKIPENYSGNAFRDETEERLADSPASKEEEVSPAQKDTQPEASAPLGESTPTALSHSSERRRSAPFGFNFDLGRLFSGGFGFEELLILAVILLVSQNEAQRDLVLLLAILLFVG